MLPLRAVTCCCSCWVFVVASCVLSVVCGLSRVIWRWLWFVVCCFVLLLLLVISLLFCCFCLPLLAFVCVCLLLFVVVCCFLADC